MKTEVKQDTIPKPTFSFQNNVLVPLKKIILTTQSVIGIEIGTNYIKIVQLQTFRGKHNVMSYRVRALPLSVKDNPPERKKFIINFAKEFIAETRVKTHYGRVALWGGGSYIFSLTVPSVSERDLKGVVGIELKKKLPFQVDLSRIIYNYYVTDKFDDGKGITFQVTCIAMDRYQSEEGVNIIKEIGLRPNAVSVIPDALGNLVSVIDPESTVTAILDVGAKESVFNFYKKGDLQFARQVPIGGDQFSLGIMKAMTSSGMANVTMEIAEKVKRQCGIPLEEDVFLDYFTDYGVIKGNQIAVALRPLMERFTTEITRTINYYYRTFRVDRIDNLYLTGGSSRLKNIDKFLSLNLQNFKVAKVECLNPLKAVKGWTDAGVARQQLVMEEAAPHLSAVFGLCIKRGGKVNLLPPKEILAQKINFISQITRVLFIIILAGLLSHYTYGLWKVQLYKKIILNTRTEIIKREPMLRQIRDYLTMKGIVTERKSLLEEAIGRQPLWGGILKELSAITPKGIALKRLDITRKGRKGQMRIIGEVFAEYTTIDLAISQYFVALEDSPFFANVKPINTVRDVYSPVPKADFEIRCDLVF